MDGKAEATHSHADATDSTSGFMSASDKAKLDGLENVDMTGYVKVLRNASGAVQDDKGWVGTMMITEDPLLATNFVQIRTDGDKPTFAMNTMEVNGFTDTITPDADGYMLATDKAVKSYVDANKTVVTVDSSLSDSSTNPVQNKVIKAAIDGKADVAHNHDGIYANASHTHDAADVTTGTFDAARIPTITDAKIQGMSASKLTGTIPTDNLPSYVDDVVEYDKQASFPPTGEAGKIYVDTTTNKTYRWSGSSYVEISASLALGTTSSTAFRGDYGNAAYQHAVTNKGSEFASGLYKITTNAEGHVTAATAVVKDDITALGIPGEDTNTTYENATSSTDGLMSAADKAKLDSIADGADKLPEGGTEGQVLTKTADGEEWADAVIPEVEHATAETYGTVKLISDNDLERYFGSESVTVTGTETRTVNTNNSSCSGNEVTISFALNPGTTPITADEVLATVDSKYAPKEDVSFSVRFGSVPMVVSVNCKITTSGDIVATEEKTPSGNGVFSCSYIIDTLFDTTIPTVSQLKDATSSKLEVTDNDFVVKNGENLDKVVVGTDASYVEVSTLGLGTSSLTSVSGELEATIGTSNSFLKYSYMNLKSANGNAIKLNVNDDETRITVGDKEVTSITDTIEASPEGNALVTDKAVADYVVAKVTFASDEDFKAYMGIS